MINWQNGITPINETNMNKLVQEDMITDAYSSSSTYAVGDYCIYENTLYKCTTAIATAENWNSAHWTAVTVTDEIKENAVAISSTQPSTEEKVWFKKGKNLCKGNFSNGTISTIEVSNRLFTYQNIELKAGVQYTFSTNMNLSTYKYAIAYSTNKFPTSSTEYDSGWQTTSSFTFTPTVNGYLGIGIAKTDSTSELSPSDISSYNFQVEQGSTATSYEAYIEKEILVKNSIGNFEKFISDNTMNFLGLVSNAMDPSIKMGFGQYNATTENIADGLPKYGSIIFLPIADSTHIGHTVILIGNYNATKGRIAIRSYINNNWEQAWSYLATTE